MIETLEEEKNKIKKKNSFLPIQRNNWKHKAQKGKVQEFQLLTGESNYVADPLICNLPLPNFCKDLQIYPHPNDWGLPFIVRTCPLRRPSIFTKLGFGVRGHRKKFFCDRFLFRRLLQWKQGTPSHSYISDVLIQSKTKKHFPWKDNILKCFLLLGNSKSQHSSHKIQRVCSKTPKMRMLLNGVFLKKVSTGKQRQCVKSSKYLLDLVSPLVRSLSSCDRLKH